MQQKMSELHNAQDNSVFSTPDPTKDFKYQNNDFGHPQVYTLSDNITIEYYNITRADIIDAVKTFSQNPSGGPDIFPAYYFSDSAV